jgi:NADH:ubiquinone oxidoreductase subunit 6 (subunit J)
MALQTVLFYVTAALILFSAVRVVTAQHIFRAALYLAVTLSLLAVQYLMMHAEFVAVVQILVYVGAVIILIIFAVMLTAQLGDMNVSQTNRLALPGFLACLGVFYLLNQALQGTDWTKVQSAAASGALAPGDTNLQSIGKTLLSGYLYPFEMIALILLTALVGAVLIARKDPE